MFGKGTLAVGFRGGISAALVALTLGLVGWQAAPALAQQKPGQPPANKPPAKPQPQPKPQPAPAPDRSRPQPPRAGVAAVNPKAVVGTWKGPTEEDGQLTLVFGSDGSMSYQFSGGGKEQGKGTFKLADGGLLMFTPTGKKDEEQWLLLLDADGKRMTVIMEEDNPADEETYRLAKTS